MFFACFRVAKLILQFAILNLYKQKHRLISGVNLIISADKICQPTAQMLS